MNTYDQSNCSQDYLWKYHFGTVFVKEDRETGEVERSRVCLSDKVAASAVLHPLENSQILAYVFLRL